MGDHRATVVIKFEMHGVKDQTDMWINWSPDEDGGCDRRIPEWCAEVANRALDKFYRAEERALVAQQSEKEAEERAELARLRAKYE